jgi:hypothetical protein
MKIGALCRRIRINDASLKEVELEAYNAPKIEKVLQVLQKSPCSNLAVEKLVLRECELTVESFTTLLLYFCKRPHGQTMNQHSTSWRSSLKSLTLCLQENSFIVPADEIAFHLFRGIATDDPPGLADLAKLNLSIPGLSERSMTALQRVLRKPLIILGFLDLTNDEGWVDDSAVEKICRSLTCKASTKLVLLQLGGNEIGNAGAQHLARMLKNNQVLGALQLGSNEIGDDGAVALANVLRTHNQTLLMLELEANQIGDVGITALAQAVTKNSSLTHLLVKKNPRVTPVGERVLVESVAEMRGLEVLEFGPLQQLANLKRLAVSMDKNHSLVKASYSFDENALLAPEEGLEALPEHSRPPEKRKMLFLWKFGVEYAKIPMPEFKLEIMAQYYPYIVCLCQINQRKVRPLLLQPEDRVPLGLWAHVMGRKKRLYDEIFCILLERPDIVGSK